MKDNYTDMEYDKTRTIRKKWSLITIGLSALSLIILALKGGKKK